MKSTRRDEVVKRCTVTKLVSVCERLKEEKSVDGLNSLRGVPGQDRRGRTAVGAAQSQARTHCTYLELACACRHVHSATRQTPFDVDLMAGSYWYDNGEHGDWWMPAFEGAGRLTVPYQTPAYSEDVKHSHRPVETDSTSTIKPPRLISIAIAIQLSNILID